MSWARNSSKGRHCVIVDDMGDTFGTGTHAAKALRDVGAASVEFWGTHGYFSGHALQKIEASPITRVSITNSMDLQPAVAASGKVSVIDIAPVLAQVIIDHTTHADPNLPVERRHIDADKGHRRALGRYVFPMMNQSTPR